MDLDDFDLNDLDWGSVPAWLGALSLLLAFSVFRRDRNNQDRSQVDRVGAWVAMTYTPKAPWESDPVGPVTIDLNIRNASDLPVVINQLAYTLSTTWLVVDREQSNFTITDGQVSGLGVWEPRAGKQQRKMFLNKVTIPPDFTWSHSQEIPVADQMPEPGVQLSFPHGVDCWVEWCVTTDSAGRLWELRPTSGRPARRIRWYSRYHEYHPVRLFPRWKVRNGIRTGLTRLKMRRP